MFTNQDLNRRSCLKGISLGAGGLFFAPLLQKVAAAADGNVTPPKRFIFFTFTNGFQESGAIPVGWKRGADAIRQESLKDAELPALKEGGKPSDPLADAPSSDILRALTELLLAKGLITREELDDRLGQVGARGSDLH